MTDAALLDAMVAVESAWLAALTGAGLAPADCAAADLRNLVADNDSETLAVGAEDGGNPVIGLVRLLRERADPAVAPWIHRGLTSQDVLDTALMLGVRALADDLIAELREQIRVLSALTDRHRATPMVARTLTQHAAPTTFGAKAAGWLNGVIDAFDNVIALVTPVQIGGAAGTLAASTELAALRTGTADPAAVSVELARGTAAALGLAPRPPGTPPAHRSPRPPTPSSAAPTAGAVSPRTSSPWPARRSANSVSRRPPPAAARRRCRTSETRCCPS